MYFFFSIRFFRIPSPFLKVQFIETLSKLIACYNFFATQIFCAIIQGFKSQILLYLYIYIYFLFYTKLNAIFYFLNFNLIFFLPLEYQNFMKLFNYFKSSFSSRLFNFCNTSPYKSFFFFKWKLP